MATSFFPSSEDAPLKASLNENINPPETSSQAQNSESLPVPTLEDYSLPPELEHHDSETEHFLEEEPTSDKTPLPRAKSPENTQKISKNISPSIPNPRDELTLQIEKIMEEDLSDVYSALTPIQKQQFKIKGEETAHKIKKMLQGARLKLGKIIKLIFEWLRILPGVNRFFLEQEAKIKAEKIVALKEIKKYIS